MKVVIDVNRKTKAWASGISLLTWGYRYLLWCN